MAVVFGKHGLTVLIGTFAALVTFVLFYLMTVFALSWGTTALGFQRGDVSARSSCSGFLFFAATIPLSAKSCRPLRTTADAALGDGRHRRLRIRLRADARRRARQARW